MGDACIQAQLREKDDGSSKNWNFAKFRNKKRNDTASLSRLLIRLVGDFRHRGCKGGMQTVGCGAAWPSRVMDWWRGFAEGEDARERHRQNCSALTVHISGCCKYKQWKWEVMLPHNQHQPRFSLKKETSDCPACDMLHRAACRLQYEAFAGGKMSSDRHAFFQHFLLCSSRKTRNYWKEFSRGLQKWSIFLIRKGQETWDCLAQPFYHITSIQSQHHLQLALVVPGTWKLLACTKARPTLLLLLLSSTCGDVTTERVRKSQNKLLMQFIPVRFKIYFMQCIQFPSLEHG